LVTNDIYARLKGKENITQKQIVKLTRIAIVIVGFLGLTIAFRFELIYDVVVWMQGISMAVLFVPVVGGLMFKGRKTEMGGLMSMVGGCGTLLILRAIEFSLFSPVFIALAVAIICYNIGNRIGEDRNQLQPAAISNGANN
jgi:SSS family solute:Na+ symporter